VYYFNEETGESQWEKPSHIQNQQQNVGEITDELILGIEKLVTKKKH
jgi:spore coat protein CotF